MRLWRKCSATQARSLPRLKIWQWTKAEKETVRRLAAKQAAGDDSDIDYSDIPKLTPEQLARMRRLLKVAVSVRPDPAVLDWLKSKGEGHLTRMNDIRMNDILTSLMEAERRAGTYKS